MVVGFIFFSFSLVLWFRDFGESFMRFLPTNEKNKKILYSRQCVLRPGARDEQCRVSRAESGSRLHFVVVAASDAVKDGRFS